MSKVTNVLDNDNSQFNNYDTSKIFVGENQYETGSYTNDEYADSPLAAGTLMGRVASSGKLIALKSNATDGSQFPVGILVQDYTVAGGDTVGVTVCVAGRVVENKVVLDPGDSLETIIDSWRRLRDHIASDTVGIKLVPSTELTGTDNV
jgi:hypothetical protein